jgi:hypothetical protein
MLVSNREGVTILMNSSPLCILYLLYMTQAKPVKPMVKTLMKALSNREDKSDDRLLRHGG